MRLVAGKPVHPRVGGEQDRSPNSTILENGSSPRGRGTERDVCGQRLAARFIPAWAGNSVMARTSSCACSVHPRVGGEQAFSWARTMVLCGSSPRGRGTDALRPRRSLRTWFIPAWAGNSILRASPCQSMTVHPRVGGEQDVDAVALRGSIGSSPRGRGTVERGLRCRADRRFIPAWAGNSALAADDLRASSVHPRVGGEQHVVN